MTTIAILGAGPAACLLAISLVRAGLRPVVIGRARTSPAVEGLSQRVVDALGQLGCRETLSLLGPRWGRVSSWSGQTVEMNGEFAVERVAFDAALVRDVRAAGVDFRAGRVRTLQRRAPGGWRIGWEDAAGTTFETQADLVLECRGHTAPKTAPDVFAGPTLVSLGRTFERARKQPPTTFVESFASGWAWAGVDPTGSAHVQLVVLPDLLAAHGGDLDAVHAAVLRQLVELPGRFGRGLQPVGPARARGIQAALRGGRVAADYLRIGDAAYTGDPLSGHGMFEAASGAIAAVPVIRTLLERPEAAALALRYMRERSEVVFRSRIEAARLHYASETRWADQPFWQRVHAPTPPAPAGAEDGAPAARFQRLPVVEDGFIVERRVVVSEAHPRGVRFIDGVDLGRLDDMVRAGIAPGTPELGRRLGAPPERVGRALRWLQVQRLIPVPPSEAAHTSTQV